MAIKTPTHIIMNGHILIMVTFSVAIKTSNYMLKLAMTAETTKASSWGRCKSLRSSFLKVIDRWASTTSKERL